MSFSLLLAGFACGFLVYFIFSNPKKLKYKVPSIGIWRIEILPTLKIKVGKSKLHIHHWLYLSVIFVFSYIYFAEVVASSQFLKGIFAGGITQGLTYSDRFKFIVKDKS